MKKQILKSVIFLVAVSLVGIVVIQTFWLRNSIRIAEKQYDDRVDRMLGDVVQEIKAYADTSRHIQNIHYDSLQIFHVVDTTLLRKLIRKYTSYHRVDSIYAYYLVKSKDGKTLYSSNNKELVNYKETYKTCLSCIWKKEYVHMAILFPEKRKVLYSQLYGSILMSVIFILIITSAFIVIIYSNIKQKKISEIKNDFINNMTHEFKTPISTISLASEMLIKGASKPSPQKIEKYSTIILTENQRMQTQVEMVLQAALIDRGQLKLKKEEVDIHQLIKSVVEGYCLESCEKDPVFEYKLSANRATIILDPVHIKNIIGNLIDNAIKYTNTKPLLKLITRNINGGVELAVSDNGIGITREAQKRIFEKFYRVSTGNIHNVKGFGLGLYYVKTIIEAHHGSVSVDSSLNNGSTFYVFLPQ